MPISMIDALSDKSAEPDEIGDGRSTASSRNHWRWIAPILILAAGAGWWLWRQDIGERVVTGAPVNSPTSLVDLSHQSWDRLLNRYVTKDGLVDYKAWKSSQEDRAALQNYLRSLAAVEMGQSPPRNARMAFWINAYNALTVEAILQQYPTKSIRNHTNPVGFNIWKHVLLPVNGREYSLDAIEHKVLRKIDEPRIHFAIVCAAIGCPRLLNEAYTAENLEGQLVRNARHFFQQEKNFRFNEEKNVIYLNPILKWFAEDFGKTDRQRLATIAPYLPSQQAREWVLENNPSVEYLEYNWGLNSIDNRDAVRILAPTTARENNQDE